VDRLDLVQLHCPPTDTYYHPEIFAALDDLVAAGAIANYGVSVERVEEGLKAIEYPGVASVQIIFNMLRQRPADHFLAEAKRRDVGVLARVPLASGLLTGKMSKQTAFDASDHRSYNRHGEAFDVGETFAGVDYDAGLAFVEELRGLVPAGATMAQVALRWILMFDGVTAAIPVPSRRSRRRRTRQPLTWPRFRLPRSSGSESCTRSASSLWSISAGRLGGRASRAAVWRPRAVLSRGVAVRNCLVRMGECYGRAPPPRVDSWCSCALIRPPIDRPVAGIG